MCHFRKGYETLEKIASRLWYLLIKIITLNLIIMVFYISMEA